jgi:hypothetical protein
MQFQPRITTDKTAKVTVFAPFDRVHNLVSSSGFRLDLLRPLKSVFIRGSVLNTYGLADGALGPSSAMVSLRVNS